MTNHPMRCRMLLKRGLLALFVLTIGGFFFESSSSSTLNQNAYQNNNCVDCHARLSSPREIAGRYLDWHISRHKSAGVGCDKCHGGDPAARDQNRAHRGVLPASRPNSRVNQVNLPETCSSCHNAVVNSFVESSHYQALKTSKLGPSCTTCHNHMASSVATYPADAATFCAFCHNSVNGILVPKPELPRRAQATMESIGRANHIVALVSEMAREAGRRRLDVKSEEDNIRLLKGLVTEAKVGWHAFTLDGPQVKSEKAFAEGLEIRDRLLKKLDQR